MCIRDRIMKAGNPALMIDPNGEMIKQLHPIAVVDAILAKKNLGTTRDMAPITIALGPVSYTHLMEKRSRKSR